MQKGLNQQACRGKKNERQSDFARDQGVAPKGAGPAGAAGAPGVRQMLRGSGTRRLAGRSEAEQNGGEQAQSKREGKRLRTDPDLVGKRQADSRGHKRKHRPDTPGG